MDFCQLISSEEEEEVDHLSALSADYNRHSRGRRRMMDVRIFDGGRNMCGTMVLKVLEWLVEMDGDERRLRKWGHKQRLFRF